MLSARETLETGLEATEDTFHAHQRIGTSATPITGSIIFVNNASLYLVYQVPVG